MAIETIPITFEKGLQEAVEDSQIPVGYCAVLENWVSESTGGLRCRRGWLNAATTSAPATRKTRSLGTFRIAEATMTPAQVQIAQGNATGTSAAATWPAATTTGNLLVIIATALSGGTISTPAGWTAGPTVSSVGTVHTIALFYKLNAASESGAVTVSGTGSVARSVQIAEYSGIATSSALDQTQTSTGTSTTPGTGTTAATTQNKELWIAGLLDARAEAMSSPTNSFSIAQQQAAGSSQAGHLERVVTTKGTASTSVTTSTSDIWVGLVATFKARNITSANYVLAAHNDTTQYAIYHHDLSDLSTGAWTLLENVVVDSTARPVAFAQGLGGVMYVTSDFSTIRRWDGSAISAVSGSPVGNALVFHRNRFFCAGTATDPSRLWYSDLASYSSWPVTSYIDVSRDDGDNIVDLAVFEDGILIAKNNSLHFLSGTGPDTFSVHQLNAGGGYAGRCICPTPYGAIVAGRRQVWLWTGGGVESISPRIEDSYQLTGDFVSTAYIDGTAYITDEGTGITYAIDLPSGAWRVEKTANLTTDGPACIFASRDTLMYGPQSSTTYSLVAYREVPRGTRARDVSLAETFKVWTPEMWPVAENQVFTPRILSIKWRQRGGTTGQTGITITPVYDGTTIASKTLAVKAAAGTYRTTVQVGDDASGKGIRSAQFKLEQTVGSGEAALIDIESLMLGIDDIQDRNSV